MSSFYAAAGAIIEENGKILMVQEAKEHIHKTWNFPGGGWEHQESIIECVKREILEETGYKADIKGFLGAYKEKNKKDGTETIVFMFTGILVEKKTERLENDIIQKKWIPVEDLDGLNFRHENRKEILRKYRENKSQNLDILWNNLELF